MYVELPSFLDGWQQMRNSVFTWWMTQLLLTLSGHLVVSTLIEEGDAAEWRGEPLVFLLPKLDEPVASLLLKNYVCTFISAGSVVVIANLAQARI